MSSQVWHVNEGSQFYLLPTCLSKNGISHPAFTPQPQEITALWPVLIFHPAEGRRLSWPVKSPTNSNKALKATKQ